MLMNAWKMSLVIKLVKMSLEVTNVDATPVMNLLEIFTVALVRHYTSLTADFKTCTSTELRYRKVLL